MLDTVILDIDGPVLEGRHRHFECYRVTITEEGRQPIPMPEYWAAKRSGASLGRILEKTGARDLHEKVLNSWLSRIEGAELLRLDYVQPGAAEKLGQWRLRRLQLIAVSLRRSAASLIRQLSDLGVAELFDDVLVCDHKDGGRGKAVALRERYPGLLPNRCVWVGDSEVDIVAAREFGCPIWVVTNGVRDEEYLAKFEPDYVRPSLASVDL